MKGMMGLFGTLSLPSAMVILAPPAGALRVGSAMCEGSREVPPRRMPLAKGHLLSRFGGGGESRIRDRVFSKRQHMSLK
jgi:hypothetical protein